jgi:SAM-dependent methyltransferase
MRELFNNLLKLNSKPMLFEPGCRVEQLGKSTTNSVELKFWDDPHISKSMLEAHLNPNHDAASRKPETIDKTIHHFFESGLLKPGMKVLDLGCGPGLYAERLYRSGVEVVGLDMSERSIEYAKKNIAETGWSLTTSIAHPCNLGSEINYYCMNFFDMDYTNEFDVVIQVFGELCTFSDEMRDRLLRLIHKALKKDGVFIFDVSTRDQRMKDGLKNSWYISGGGFWRQGTHMVLEQGFDYQEQDVWLDQYVVMDDQGCDIYRNWFHDYSLESINTVLTEAGFRTKYVWNDLTGSIFAAGGDWIAIGAIKKEGDQNKWQK